MRLFDPRYVATLKRFNRLGVVILHALEQDYPIAGSADFIVKHIEHSPNAKGLDFVLYELLGRLL